MRETELRELLIYLVTSAAGLPGEPKAYGPLRLIDSANKLAGILLEEHPEDEALQVLIRTIERDRNKSMSDPEQFLAMLDEAAAAAVDLV